MKCSIVNNKMAFEENDARIDPEFFHPDYLKLERKLITCNHSLLGDLCYLFDGPFGSDLLSSSYSGGGVPALRMQNITSDGLLNLGDVEFITEEKADQLIKHIAYPKEVVVTKIGFLGFSTVLPKDYQRYFFRREITRLLPKEEEQINTYYLSTFFNTDIGRKQALRFSSGTTRDRILLVNQRNMIIPLFSDRFQKSIETICKRSYKYIGVTKTKYQQAQILLLSELGLLEWKPLHRISFLKKFADTQATGRFDAEYFQPKYAEIKKVIKDYKGGCDIIKNVFNIKDKNIFPKEKINYKYIELANIGNSGEITGFTEAEGQELPTRARRKVNRNDVIISSIEGSLSSVALITKDYDNALCSTGFFVVNSDKINSETLLVLLKGLVGQLQLKKGCSGTILTAINREELDKIVLPLVKNEIQEQIQQRIIESIKLRKESKKLLEASKKAVEMAIEKTEEVAEKWLKKEIEKIGVDLN